MQKWKQIIGATSICLTMLGATPVYADIDPSWLRETPPEGTVAVPISAPLQLTVNGIMTYVDLEGGFYAVDGYRLIGDQEEFKQHLGSWTSVIGQLADEEASIFMTKAIKVEELIFPADSSSPAVTGEVTYVDLEGGFYAVDGYRLIGDQELFKSFLGKSVVVLGTVNDQPSTQMTKAINVESIDLLVLFDDDQPTQDVPANRAKPTVVTVDGQAVSFDRELLVSSGTLLIPLRSIVVAGGGSIHWDAATKTATVEMPDRMAYFVAGNVQAEMNENNVRYLQRNLITMAKAPETLDGRMYISADALSTILGLTEQVESGDALHLVSHNIQGKKPADAFGTLYGTIKEMGTGDTPSILIACGTLSDGEDDLVWAMIGEETTITIHSESGDQAASLSDLAVGQQVIVDLSGPMMLSYPGRAGAAAITIEK